MKTIVLLLLLISGAPLWAQDTDDTAGSEAGSQVQPPPGGESVQEPVPWPRPFTPSEEVGADSSISFPTDI